MQKKNIKIHPERITREDKNLVNNLDYDGVEFPVREKDLSKIEKKNNICINMFSYKNKLVFPIYVSEQKYEYSVDLLLLIDKISHIVCISKSLTDLCFTEQRIKTKNTFIRVVYSVLVVKMY